MINQLIPGTLLNNTYTVIKILGKGGMGTVYLAQEVNNPGKNYAIKELISTFSNPSQEEIAQKTFRTEIEFLSQLNHRQLPRIYGTFIQWGKNYLVMEYVEGDTLENIIAKKKGALPEDEVLDWIIQLTDVLDYLHNQHSGPVVYRDMKPANIIITPMGVPKIVDLGIARRYHPGKSTDTLRFGTPGYAAPEQFKGMGQSTPKTDIYGLGAMMHQLLTGYDPTVTPFKFPPARSLNRSISEELEKIINKAIEKRSEDRYESISIFKDTLSFYTREKYKKPGGMPGVISKSPAGETIHGESQFPARRRFAPCEPLPRTSKGKICVCTFLATFITVGGMSLLSSIGTFGSISNYPGLLGLIFWIGFIPAMLITLLVYLGDFRYY